MKSLPCPLRVCAGGLFLLLAACHTESLVGPEPTDLSPDSSPPAAIMDAGEWKAPPVRDASSLDAGRVDAAQRAGLWELGVQLPEPPPNGGDPELGRWQLLNGSYLSCGIPYRLLDNPITRALLGEDTGERLPGRSGKNADMAYYINVFETVDGAEVMNQNCLLCHAGYFNGTLIEGLGDSTRDFTGAGPGASRGPSLRTFALLLGATPAELANLDKVLAVDKAVTPRGGMQTVGTNPADAIAVVLGEHKNFETLGWSEQPLRHAVFLNDDGTERPNAMFTADPPPWWRVHKKNALFYNGMQRGAARGTMAAASGFCVDSKQEFDRIDVLFRDIHAYVESLRAPLYPFPIDAALAASGKPVFEQRCAGCHGTYDDDPRADELDTYPNLLIPLAAVQTDPVIAEIGRVHAIGAFDDYNASILGSVTPLEPAKPFPGYTPAPLDGIWATAPYLHNGSVPTLEAVLDSSRRPKYWKRVDYDSTHFEQDTLGFPYVELPYGQSEAPAAERKFIYDTTVWSQTNGGHTFGDALSAEERRALLEYLKTL
jgi:mono/diheme cytochrome c family protein